MGVRVIMRKAGQLYTKSRIPGVDYTVNQYVGCQFGCRYCYARFLTRWKDYGPWGSWVEVKENAPELARRHVKGNIAMSTVSDPYQPLEAELKLTRAVLRFMDKRNNLSILTKSPLVTRDIDILKEFMDVEVGLTLNTFSGREKRLFEPLTPLQRTRINALQRLHEEGLRTYAFISPIIPGITDVIAIIEETRGFADRYFFEVLNLKASGKNFREILRENYPESYSILTDDEKFAGFIGRLEEEIRKSQVKTNGIETHRLSSSDYGYDH
ncbi:SPL family radical SAM protein [Thermococcus sp.]